MNNSVREPSRQDAMNPTSTHPETVSSGDAEGQTKSCDPTKSGPFVLRELNSSFGAKLIRVAVDRLVLEPRDEMRVIGDPLSKVSTESVVEAIQLLRPPVLKARKDEARYDVVGNASTVVWFRRLNPVTGSRAGRLHCLLIDPEDPSPTRPPTANDWRALDEWVIDLLFGRLKGSVAADVARAIKGSIFQTMPRLPNLRRKIADILATR